MTTLDTLCSNLNFNYESLLLSSSDKKEYADARMAFHHSIESIRNQALFSVILMRQLLAKLRPENADPNIALLLPDIFPESSESLCSVILEALLRAPGLTRAQHISVLSRRGEKLHDKLPKAFEHIKMHWDWSSTQLLSSFDVVIVVCSAMHFPLTQELILNQISYSKTLFFVTTNGVTINRAKNMIKSSAVVIPCFDYQSELLGHRFDQQCHKYKVCFNLLKPQPAQWKPDLVDKVKFGILDWNCSASMPFHHLIIPVQFWIFPGMNRSIYMCLTR
ncbi:hypothetical protein BATDEDRAFT_28032 [Batrachochytrium dendrobatidis JAM81]|uniref:Uncharacterized protein n=1 Tax=Batrachochytrium dendrobatidis (strain JAM81 / FGSC 10211) TaxID=684364 RepID=F4PCM2_BATDJ|nr:uncharacterized protein BATDEDRAFT_28032 [Batrachochytrium dendrobatidis JAM81]EGF76853.1 hypothetical protein BATDEDRAFT_28032 [Batrachochytrium dendrobatidis JAM81]|eukprot:XP_006682390.1 hypothetical protein BATDEDRAFT_28032 [Batrachochytrium dendrobatidis JAM81]